MTGNELVTLWLKTKVGAEFTQLNVQRELDVFQKQYGKHFLPESLARYFRMVRQSNALQKDGLEISEVQDREHTTYTVKRIDSLF